jgi:hypothetical protein
MMTREAEVSQSWREEGTDLREVCCSHVWLPQDFVMQKAIYYWHPKPKQQMLFIKKFYVKFNMAVPRR